jgi:hypothetical protein
MGEGAALCCVAKVRRQGRPVGGMAGCAVIPLLCEGELDQLCTQRGWEGSVRTSHVSGPVAVLTVCPIIAFGQN